jgi:hypothetical protein
MKFISKVLFVFLISTGCSAEDGAILNPENDPHFNLMFGISPFDGILGFEYQNGNHSFGIGAPTHISYRYYFNPHQNSKFWGIYFGGYSLDDYNERVDGILFQELETKYIGVGMGKRWQWPTGFNVTAGLAIEFYDDEYSNPGALRTKTKSGAFPFPCIAAGYKF